MPISIMQTYPMRMVPHTVSYTVVDNDNRPVGTEIVTLMLRAEAQIYPVIMWAYAGVLEIEA